MEDEDDDELDELMDESEESYAERLAREEVDLKAHIQGMTDRDKTLTVEQRNAEAQAQKLRLLRHNVQRILTLLDVDAPSVIICSDLTSLWSRAWGLWEEEMAKEFGDFMIGIARKRGHQCLDCGDQLPLPVKGEYCARCIKDQDDMEDYFGV